MAWETVRPRLSGSGDPYDAPECPKAWRGGGTIVVVALLLAVAALDGALRGSTPPPVLHRWSSTATTLVSRPWRLLTSIPLTSGPHMTAAMCLAVVVMFGAAEWVRGWRRAAVVGVSASIVATIACDVVLLVGSSIGVAGARSAAHAADFGPSAVTAGTAGLVARSVLVPGAGPIGPRSRYQNGGGGRLWGAALIAVVVLNGIVVHHQLADWEHVVAFGFGAVVPQ